MKKICAYIKKVLPIRKIRLVTLASLVVLSAISMGNNGNINAYSANVYSISWNDGSSSKVENINSSSEQSATMELKFSTGAGVSAAPGEIEIRLPKYIFYNRDGTPVDNYSIPLAVAPATHAGESFNYTIEGDEIVIRNHETVPSATYFNVGITYKYKPRDIASGYTKDDIQAKFKMNIAGQAEENFTSNNISIQVNTNADNGVNANKYAAQKFEKWDINWGVNKPTDADQYFYVWWSYYVSDAYNSQPMYYNLSENVGSKGTIVGWVDGTGNLNNMQSSDFNTAHKNIELVDPGTRFNYSVLVKYPKSALTTQTRFENVMSFEGKTIDTGQIIKKDTTGVYNYQSVNFQYAGDSFNTRKFRFDYGKTSISLSPFLNGNGDSELNYSLTASSQGYSLTKVGDEYGKKTYTNTVIDDQLYMGNERLNANERLNKEDYAISSFGVVNWKQVGAYIDDNKGWVEYETTPNLRSDIKVYLRADDSDTWNYYGVIKAGNTATTYSFVDSNGKETAYKNLNVNSVTNKIEVPETLGYTQIKFVDETKAYRSTYDFNVNIKPKLTEHMKQLLSANTLKAEGHNVSTFVVKDSENKIANVVSDGTVSGTLKDEILEQDNKKYGATVQHGQSSFEISDPTPTANSSKKILLKAKDDVNGEFKFQVELMGSSQLISASISEYKIEDYLSIQKKGTFYDLLPIGTKVDQDSIKIYSSSGQNVLDKSDYSVKYVENWRDSGRVMMIVEFDDPYANYCLIGTDTALSEVKLRFDMIYSFDSYFDYGNYFKNYAAYQSNDYLADNAFADDPTGYTSFDSQMWVDNFKDLNEDGNPTGSTKNTMYMTDDMRLANYDFASQSGYSKKVKAINKDEMSDFSSSAEAEIDGEYVYQLRYVNGASITASNVILYDVLEQGMGSNKDYWQGTLIGIDTSRAESQGIAPVIYYSTKDRKDFDLSKIGKGDQDLSDTTIWTTTKPDDLSKVSAVAIDLSKKADGTNYTVPVKSSVSVELHMKTPTQYKSSLAYNNSYSRVTTVSVGGSIPTESSEVCNTVHVSMKKLAGVPFSFNKTDENGVKLKNAEFTLYQCTNTIADHKHDDVVSTTTKDCWEEYMTITSDDDGKVDFGNLPFGNYQLVETRAPDGYQLPTGQWRVSVNENSEIVITAKGNQMPPAFEKDKDGVWSLMNYQRSALPLSGGYGIVLFSMSGLLLVSTSLFFGFKRKKLRM